MAEEHKKQAAEHEAAEAKALAEKQAADEEHFKKLAAAARPLTDKQRKAGIRMEIARIDQEIANLGVRKLELRTELAAK